MSSSRGKKGRCPYFKEKEGSVIFRVLHPFLRFPIGPQEELFQILWARPLIVGCCIDWVTEEQVQLAEVIRALLTIDPWELFFGIIELTLVCQLSVPEFGTALGLYMDEFKEETDLHALNHHIHRSSSQCWDALVSGGATYNPSNSKASALPPSLRYLHAILVPTITRSTRWSCIGRGSSPLAPMLLGWLDASGSSA
ncbi:hypothetical protein GOBAR_AA19119 [Gossypium barbadense]|uniref:Uncharacterized protein n=1 Tax=Gossypium barbadense TaxID=3634 RepID=A0A2P5XDY0_GOSBA|nr:hypothetical protein GOBAR_AA19119 [Gossypium barbadense]